MTEATGAVARLSNSRRSFRARLLLLSIGILLPAVVCAGWLLWTQAAETDRQYEQQLLGTARALSSAVDQKIAEATAINETLATAARVGEPEYAEFRRRALAALQGRGGWIVLSGPDGRQLVNTRVAADAVLPGPRPLTKGVLEARRTGHTRLSDLTYGPAVKRLIIAVNTPVQSPFGIRNLSYIFEPSAFVPLFQAQKLPPGWLVTLVDRDGMVIARSRGQQQFLGHSSTGDLKARIQRTQDGVLKSRSLDGVDMLTAFQRSSVTGWTLITAVPRSQMQATTARSLTRAGLLALLLLVVSGLLTWALSWGLARQVRLLVDDASTMAGGEVAPPRAGLMTELADVQEAISRASRDLAAREERHTLMVNELNHRVRNTLATVQSLAAHTFRERAGPGEIAVFNGRLQGLSAAHALLIEVNWTETNVEAVLRRCLPPDERIALQGPPVAVAAHGGVALGMVCHELTTNSLKYGALSRPEGKVSIEWRQAGPLWMLSWTETGGPPTAAPARRGFGSRLIERLVKQDLGGSAVFDYRPEGLVFTATFGASNEQRWNPELQAG